MRDGYPAKSAGVLLLVLALMLTILPPARVAAAITTPFTTRFDVNANGAILLRGNANLTCPIHLLTPTCADARNGIGSAATEELNDNGYPMIFTDADGDPATFNDSTATIDMPAGSTVLFAGLYWGADPSAGSSVGALLGAAAPTPANKNRVRFRTPAGPAWNPITASSLYTISANGAYQGFADVTALVAGVGNGVYGVADIQSGRGTDRYAGWTLAIAYSNPAEALRSLRVYDGFGSITSGSVSIPVTGFETPHSGTVRAEVGAVAYEGDLGKSGDGLQLNGQSLSDGANPANNVFNSTVSQAGAIVGGRSPNYRNLLGVDIDRLDASGVLGNAATSATLTMTTAGETYYPGVITIAIDLYAPKIVTTMTATDVNGGPLVPGDEIEYRIAVRNDGNDIADGVTLADAMPVFTTYVPGTLRIQGSAVTDAADADGAEAGGGTAVFRLGNIPYLGSTYVTFRVKTDLNTPAGYAIANMVNVSYTGRTTSVAVASVGSTAASTVLQPDSDLTATLTVVPTYLQRAALPAGVTWTGIVRNLGPDPEPAARAELTLPAGLTAGALPAGCVAAGQVVTCALGPLLAGHQASVSIPAVADASAASTAVATLAAAGTGRDTVSGNNTATAPLAVNTPPTAVADTATTTNGTPVSIDVTGNDTSAQPLLVSITAMPPHGAAVVEADGTITYTPVLGWTGADTFTYEVDDGHGGTGTATVTVTTANALPTAFDDARNAPPATAVTIGVLANDTDPNSGFGDSVSLIGFGQPQSGAGVVTQTGPQLTYTPDVSFSGRAHFTYTIADSHGGQATGHVYVDVENAAPTAAGDAATTPFQTVVLIDVLNNDTDPNVADVKILDSVGAPGSISAGQVRYQPPAGFSGTVTFPYTMKDGGGLTSTATVTVTVLNAAPVAADLAFSNIPFGQYLDVDVLGSATDANLPPDTLRVSGATNPSNGTTVLQPDGSIRYTPDARFSGADQFDYTIDDGHGGTDTGRVTVTVVNALPVARPDAVTVRAGIAYVIDVLANDDDDPNGDPLTVTVTSPPAHGTATVGPGRKITYTPGAGYSGSDSFGYTLSDGIGSSGAAVTIGVVNSPPVARADSITTDTDTAVIIDPLANDDDPNLDALTLAGTTAATHGTLVHNADDTLTYTPAAGFYGTDAIGYTIEDPAGSASSAIITITVRNAAPIAVDDAFTVQPQVVTVLNVLANDHDPNTGQVLRVASAGTAGKGAVVLRPDGTITYTSAAGNSGPDTFSYVVSDDLGRTDTGLVTVTIVANAPPVARPDTSSVLTGRTVLIDVLANDTDVNTGQTLTIDAAGLPGHGSASLSGGRIRYAPTGDQTGLDTFTYQISDGAGGTASATVEVIVIDGRPPAVPDRAAATKPGQRVGVPLPGTDHQGRAITVTGVGTPAHGTVVLNADGSVTYTPDPGFTGTDTFTYTVVDANGNVAQASVVIVVGLEASTSPSPGPSLSPSPSLSPAPGVSASPHPTQPAQPSIPPGPNQPEPSSPPRPSPTDPINQELPTTGSSTTISLVRAGAAAVLTGAALHLLSRPRKN
ncbi:putative repeat protein (TIGR01451 family) [Actinoplanes lutulentus]|uniref:Putative repeat protein (TIGR01451 family) n=1 Tax=Actinoplanes lutulentus TaxID=1287878 RepID=A0A327ZC59_9ACTN|nr:putative repeat protein (TIGR01451 family) [Actinoplanes lutulentus]